MKIEIDAEQFREGSIVNTDYKKSFDLYMQASKENNTKAMYYIGFFYFNGQGIARNEVKAIEWMKRAESLGHKRSANFLKLNNLR